MEPPSRGNNPTPPPPPLPTSLSSSLDSPLSSADQPQSTQPPSPPPKNPLAKLTHLIQRFKQSPRRSQFVIGGLLVICLIGTLAVIFLKPDLERIAQEYASPQATDSPLVPSGFTKLVISEREPPFFTLASKTESRFGILPQETFTLIAQGPVDEAFIKQILASSVPMRITMVKPNEFHLVPQNPLSKDQSIIISLKTKSQSLENHIFDRDYSWAYQTQGDFRVVSFIPGHEKTGVPVNTGIEFVLSQDDYQDPAPLISISPAIKYRLERRAETLSIVPENPLSYETTYTVTLKKGLNLRSRQDPLESDTTISFQTESFKQREAQPYLSLNDTFIQITPRDKAQVKVYASNLKDNGINFELYKFASTDDFLASRKSIDQANLSWYSYFDTVSEVDTNDLSRIATAKLTILNQPTDYQPLEYLELPEALPEGLYLAKFRYGEKGLRQLWVQSTFLSAYTQIGRKTSLVWLNSLDEATTINLPQVKPYPEGPSFFFNNQAIASFTTPESLVSGKSPYLRITNLDNRELILPVDNLSHQALPNQKTPQDYWSYFYKERRVYLPDDTLYFWGVIKDRDTNTPPNSVSVSIGQGWENDNGIHSQTITPAADGSFIGSIKLSGISTGWYNLFLKVGDLSITHNGFEVYDYTKPEMKIEVVADKKAIFAGDTVNYSIKTSFFDGTPVSNMELSVNGATTATLTTDTQGTAKISVTSTYDPDTDTSYRQYPRYETITVTPNITQQATIEGFGSVYVFGPKLSLRTSTTQNKENANLKLQLNHLDLTSINTGSSNESIGNPASGISVKLTFTKKWWERHEDGTYYDFVEKVTHKKYRYVSKSEVIHQGTLTTNSEGNADYAFTMEPEKSYDATLEVTDALGRVVKDSVYFYYYQSNYSQSNQDSGLTLNLDRPTNTFSLGDQIQVQIKQEGKEYQLSDKARVLYTTVNRGRQESLVTTSPSHSFTFESKHLPNTAISAMVFTGTHYRNAGITLDYQESDSQLDLAITPIQPTYGPGETAQVVVNVTHQNQPQANTTVNLVLVDQALAAMGQVIKPSVLSSLYAFVPPDIYYRYFTHKPLIPDSPAAEKGGGGGDRELFKDTPFFGSATTDSEGNATFTFDLSDNITTWIMYAQALTQDLKAGQAENFLPATKPFFATNNFPRFVLSGDQPFVGMNSFGTGVSTGQPVTFESVFQTRTEQVLDTQKTTGQVFKETVIPFPSLAPGEYHTIIRATSNELEDGVKYPLTVLSTRLDLDSSETHALKAGESLTKLSASFIPDQTSELTVIDTGKGRYFFSLLELSYCYSNRLEKRLAANQANQLLAQYFDIQGCSSQPTTLSSFQTPDGGLSQVNWGGSHLDTTTWATFIDAKQFDQSKLEAYFTEQLDHPRAGTIDKIQAAWGLTMLDKPQILTLNQLKNTAATYEEKIMLALALYSSGDTESAYNIYLDILADYGYERTPYIRIQPPTKNLTNNTFVLDTSHTLLLGSLVHSHYSPGLYEYVNDFGYRAEDIVTNLAQVRFIESELVKVPPEKTAITFSAPGISIQKDLFSLSAWSTPLTPSQLKQFNLAVTSGQAEAVIRYQVPPTAIPSLSSDDRLKLSRKFSPVAKGDLKPGSIVKIELTFNVDKAMGPLGGYIIKDHLPSGLALIQDPTAYGLKPSGYVEQISPNVVESYFYNSDWWQKHGSKRVVYFARAIAPGTYLAEPALLQSQKDLSVIALTEGTSVIIKPN